MRLSGIIVVTLIALVFLLNVSPSWAVDARAEYEEGYKLYEEGKFPEAITRFTKAIEANEGYLKAYVYRGTCYFLLENHQKALEDLNKALQLDPSNATALFFRGQAYFYLGYSQKAIEDYDRFLKIEPENPKGYFQRALADYRLGNLDECINDASRAISYDPKQDSTFVLRGAAYWRKELFDGAIRDFKMAVDLNPDSSYNRLFNFISQDMVGDPPVEELAGFYETTENQEWPFPAVAMMLGEITPEECLEAADNAFKEQSKLDKAKIQAFFFVSQYYLLQDDGEGAKEYLEKVASSNKNLFLIQDLASYQLEKLKNME